MNLRILYWLSAAFFLAVAAAPSNADGDDNWTPLFNGADLAGWRDYGGGAPVGWRVEDGALHFPGEGGSASGNDLVTQASYTNFELELEWKVLEGGNSGIFYLVTPGHDAIYWAAPEMQVLDDARHPDGQDPLTSAGSAYALYPAPRGVVKPAGEWNHVRIILHGDHVEHWMNGQQIVTYQLGSEDWLAAVARSKFADWQHYGRSRAGHIGLQDHGDPVWFRNLRIRALD